MYKIFSRKGRPGYLLHRDDCRLTISHLNPSVLICTELSKRCYSFLLTMRKTSNTRHPRRLLDRLQGVREKFVDDGLMVTSVLTVSGQ